MRKAILTIVIGERIEKVWELTRPNFEAYADKVGADLIVMKEMSGGFPSAHWLKLAIHEFLHKKYHRLIYLDADLIIRPDTPDLFEIVPETELGIFNEGKWTPRAIAIHECMVKFNRTLPKWDKTSYYNTGVMVVSRGQRHIFRPIDAVPNLRYSFGEQTFLNFRILSEEVKVKELNFKYNRMSLMNRWLGMTRLDSYIVHYAGIYDTEVLLNTIRKDLADWGKDAPNYHYEFCIFINVGGGLGDQINAEPSIRFLMEKISPGAECWVLTRFPGLFSHLPVKATIETPELKRPAIYEVETHPSPTMTLRKFLCHFFAHPVDYIAMAILKRTLPREAKRIRIPEEMIDRAEVSEYNPDIIVHPGLGWPIKTFPVEWWTRVIEGLAQRAKVAVVGAYVAEKNGVMDFPLPAGVLDLRNKTTLKGFIALIEKTPILLTNDSSPTHIAGAFDNWIVLIPTCQHPDHLLPWRYGTQDFKTAALYKKLLDDDYRRTPMQPDYTITEYHADVKDYIPEPEEVINKVLEIHGVKPMEINRHVSEGTPLIHGEKKGDDGHAYTL